MTRLTYIFILMGCLQNLPSCRKFVSINGPSNQITGSEVFTDSTNVNSAILGIYVLMMQNFALNLTTGGLSTYVALSSDELRSTSSNIQEQEFYTNELTAQNSVNETHFWTHGYRIIYAVNACLDGVQGSTLPVSTKNAFIGELKFIRGFVFFNLVNLYGPIPLPLSTDYHVNRLLARSSESEVYEQIIKDLHDASNLLPKTSGPFGKFRPNSFASLALLAKVQMYKGNWVQAEDYADKVINSNQFMLEADLNKVFISSGNEAIWKLSPVVAGIETWEGYYIIPSSASSLPRFALSEGLLNSFEPDDERKIKWLKSTNVNGIVYYFPYKYKSRTASATATENNVILRLADTYLIRAESRAMSNNLAGSLEDLNKVRKRAGLATLILSTKTELLEAIQQERRIEFFCEGGNRWFDLKRTKRIDEILGVLKLNWRPEYCLFPIPSFEIERNPNLIQNVGYE